MVYQKIVRKRCREKKKSEGKRKERGKMEGKEGEERGTRGGRIESEQVYGYHIPHTVNFDHSSFAVS